MCNVHNFLSLTYYNFLSVPDTQVVCLVCVLLHEHWASSDQLWSSTTSHYLDFVLFKGSSMTYISILNIIHFDKV